MPLRDEQIEFTGEIPFNKGSISGVSAITIEDISSLTAQELADANLPDPPNTPPIGTLWRRQTGNVTSLELGVDDGVGSPKLLPIFSSNGLDPNGIVGGGLTVSDDKKMFRVFNDGGNLKLEIADGKKIFESLTGVALDGDPSVQSRFIKSNPAGDGLLLVTGGATGITQVKDDADPQLGGFLDVGKDKEERRPPETSGGVTLTVANIIGTAGAPESAVVLISTVNPTASPPTVEFLVQETATLTSNIGSVVPGDCFKINQNVPGFDQVFFFHDADGSTVNLGGVDYRKIRCRFVSNAVSLLDGLRKKTPAGNYRIYKSTFADSGTVDFSTSPAVQYGDIVNITGTGRMAVHSVLAGNKSLLVLGDGSTTISSGTHVYEVNNLIQQNALYNNNSGLVPDLADSYDEDLQNSYARMNGSLFATKALWAGKSLNIGDENSAASFSVDLDDSTGTTIFYGNESFVFNLLSATPIMRLTGISNEKVRSVDFPNPFDMTTPANAGGVLYNKSISASLSEIAFAPNIKIVDDGANQELNFTTGSTTPSVPPSHIKNLNRLEMLTPSDGLVLDELLRIAIGDTLNNSGMSQLVQNENPGSENVVATHINDDFVEAETATGDNASITAESVNTGIKSTFLNLAYIASGVTPDYDSQTLPVGACISSVGYVANNYAKGFVATRGGAWADDGSILNSPTSPDDGNNDSTGFTAQAVYRGVFIDSDVREPLVIKPKANAPAVGIASTPENGTIMVWTDGSDEELYIYLNQPNLDGAGWYNIPTSATKKVGIPTT